MCFIIIHVVDDEADLLIFVYQSENPIKQLRANQRLYLKCSAKIIDV